MTPTPFQLFSTLIFALSIVHVFFTPTIFKAALALQKKQKHHEWQVTIETLLLLSEIELVFGLWLIPLFGGYALFYSWSESLGYLTSRDYTEALYMVVIVLIVSASPLITFGEKVLEKIARLGKDSPTSWWWVILCLGPLSSMLLKEPGAMALLAVLLGRKFYHFRPSNAFKYVTLALLFLNVALSGLLSSFSSRSLYLLTSKRELSTYYMLRTFGWKALLGILLITSVAYLVFRKEFRKFPGRVPALERGERKKVPLWVTLGHLLFAASVAYVGNQGPLLVLLGLCFLGFYKITAIYQHTHVIKQAFFVGFFFAALLILGELQGWWIREIFPHLEALGTEVATLILSAFIDNAVVIYLVPDIFSLTDPRFYAAVVGSIAAGGLTVIANVPNPIGYTLLSPYFKRKISGIGLFTAALIPTLLIFLLFWALG